MTGAPPETKRKVLSFERRFKVGNLVRFEGKTYRVLKVYRYKSGNSMCELAPYWLVNTKLLEKLDG